MKNLSKQIGNILEGKVFNTYNWREVEKAENTITGSSKSEEPIIPIIIIQKIDNVFQVTISKNGFVLVDEWNDAYKNVSDLFDFVKYCCKQREDYAKIQTRNS